MKSLFSNNFNQDAFWAPTVKFAIKDLFPGAKVEATLGDGNDNFPTHDLAFDVGVSVIFAGIVMAILVDRGGVGGRDGFEPLFVIVMQPTFIVINKD